MQICFKLNGQEVCIEIPVLVNPPHIGPDPDPWILGGIIDKGVAQELQAMSTIAAAAEKLPAEHQKTVGAALSEMTAAFEQRIPESKIKLRKPRVGGPGPDPAF